MATQAEIQALYVRSTAQYSDLVSLWVSNINIGNQGCIDEIYTLRDYLIAIKNSITIGDFTSVTIQNLYSLTLSNIGLNESVPIEYVYFGFLDAKTIISESAILASINKKDVSTLMKRKKSKI